ncbi:MAG: NAD(P)-binding domain-containing protein, partial [Pseudomonadota bacterium]
MTIAILGAGAFGTALAIALSRDHQSISLWGRDDACLREMRQTRRSCKRLPGHELPGTLHLKSDLASLDAEIFLLAVPTQQLRQFLEQFPKKTGTIVACCKGFDRETGHGPTSSIKEVMPNCEAGILSGPSFAEDIARGLPTALTIASQSESTTKALQDQLTRPALRLYRTTDVTGVEVGGGLKNVIAIAAGMTIGSGL